MLVNVLCDQNELRTSQNPARTIPKGSKSHHFEGILLSGRFGIPPCGSASICLDLRRVYQLLRGAPPFGRWIGSVPLRGLRPLRSTPPIHLPKGSAPTPDLLNSTPEPAKWMQNRTPVCQIDRSPIIRKTLFKLCRDPGIRKTRNKLCKDRGSGDPQDPK